MNMKLGFDLDSAVALLNGDGDEVTLETVFMWSETPQGEDFWVNECNAMRGYKYDRNGEEVDVEQRDLSETALDYIRSLVAEKLGIRAPGLKPAGEAMARVVENVEAAISTDNVAERNALPARALRFGQPQIMGGLGHWDNARYAPNDEDEAKS